MNNKENPNIELSEIGYLSVKLKQMQNRNNTGVRYRRHLNSRRQQRRQQAKFCSKNGYSTQEALFNYSTYEILLAETNGRVLPGLDVVTQAELAGELGLIYGSK